MPAPDHPIAEPPRADTRGDIAEGAGGQAPLPPHTAEIAGIVEDERLRAVVRTDGADTVVTIEGSLDSSTAPVVDELLDAVDRWQAASRRRAQRARRPAQSTRLWLDASRVRTLDPAVRRVLESRAARWRARHGPCVTWCGAPISRRAGTPRPAR